MLHRRLRGTDVDKEPLEYRKRSTKAPAETRILVEEGQTFIRYIDPPGSPDAAWLRSRAAFLCALAVIIPLVGLMFITDPKGR